MIIPRRCMQLTCDSLEGDKYGIRAIEDSKIKYMLDIGASYGLMSILSRLLFPHIKILAVEPFSETFDALVRNIENMRIRCLHRAFGTNDMFVLCKDRKTPLCNSFLTEEARDEYYKNHSANTFECVQGISLGNLFDYARFIPEKTYLKIDCEGAEHYLPDDSKACDILRQCPYISIEVHEVQGKWTAIHFKSFFCSLLNRTHRIETIGSIVKAEKC